MDPAERVPTVAPAVARVGAPLRPRVPAAVWCCSGCGAEEPRDEDDWPLGKQAQVLDLPGTDCNERLDLR
jgi:hypothetical protein